MSLEREWISCAKFEEYGGLSRLPVYEREREREPMRSGITRRHCCCSKLYIELNRYSCFMRLQLLYSIRSSTIEYLSS